MAATMAPTDAVALDGIPRLRWSDADHRFHFSVPFAAEPGADGFVLLQQIDDADSLNAMALPVSERQHIKEMERFNAIIKEVENSAHLRDTVRFLERQRAHSDEFHERVVTEDDLKPRVVKKKGWSREKTSPKRSSSLHRQKPTRMGRVHQPK